MIDKVFTIFSEVFTIVFDLLIQNIDIIKMLIWLKFTSWFSYL